jgi:hypothetical protein
LVITDRFSPSNYSDMRIGAAFNTGMEAKPILTGFLGFLAASVG